MKEEGEEWLHEIHARYSYRMHSLSEFFKGMLQRFTCWFNREQGRRGTLWESRFRSVIVQDGLAARTMAAYIDLNPVRAGIVEDPKDYRFCGYAEAVVGNELAAAGLRRVWVDYLGADKSPQAVLQAHRSLIFGKGGNPWEVKGQVMDRRKVAKVLEEQDGVLPRAAVLRCRIRYFTETNFNGSLNRERFATGVFARLPQSRFARRRK
jgi:hypothetical protein